MTHRLMFDRFPVLELNGFRLVWDTRQASSDLPERVYIHPDLSDEIKSQLRLRAQKNSGLCIETADAMFLLGRDSSEALGHPSRRLCIVGVTGTNGKTSIVEALSWLYSSSGRRVLQIGTLGVSLWERADDGRGRRKVTLETGFTTPEAPSLHQLFHESLKLGVDTVVMEVSSHALTLGRVAGIDFDAGLFSNLSQDHLDFHGSMNAYGEAKRRLFSECLRESTKSIKYAVLGAPDELSREFVKETVPHLISFSTKVLEIGQQLEIVQNTLKGLQFKLDGFDFASRLMGTHNAWNLSLALALLRAQGYAYSELQSLVPDFPGPVGRMERVAGNCFVDYAHTPDALENVLKAAQEFREKPHRIFCVMGCGGNRDRTKRPLMGAIASHYADRVWITNDNPRFEDPRAIADQIYEGVPNERRDRVEIVLDRHQSISEAIRSMKGQDILLVTGKGHETYQIIGDQKHHFSDQEEILRCCQGFEAVSN